MVMCTFKLIYLLCWICAQYLGNYKFQVFMNQQLGRNLDRNLDSPISDVDTGPLETWICKTKNL